MHIAVTGATGFLGRYVVPALQASNVRVTAMLRPGSDAKVWLQNVPSTAIDMAEPPTDAYERLGRPDAVVHLAWQELRNFNSLHHFETELPLQYRFLKLLIEGGLRRLVVAGTCFEYGIQSGPLSETHPLSPVNPYGFAKNSLRCQLEFLKTMRQFSLVWARLFYVYGEGQAANSLLSQLERAIAAGDERFNMSEGEQLRDFLHATKVAGCLTALTLSKCDAGPVNVCSGKPTSVRSLVESWIAERHATVALNRGYYAYPSYEPMAFWGDRTKLESLIGASV